MLNCCWLAGDERSIPVVPERPKENLRQLAPSFVVAAAEGAAVGEHEAQRRVITSQRAPEDTTNVIALRTARTCAIVAVIASERAEIGVRSAADNRCETGSGYRADDLHV